MKNKKQLFIITVLVGALILVVVLMTACAGNKEAKMGPQYNMPAAIKDGRYCLADADGVYNEIFIDGVNMGAASAGNFPGEFGISKDTYLRWFGYISDMNVHVIRVYVNQMPEFYEALAEYNAKADEPLYLIHGVYCNEDLIDEYNDAYNEEFRSGFQTDIKNAVDMIHGSADIEKLPGNAGGKYTADVSQWVIGWILGIEWNADLVNATDNAHKDVADYNEKYIRTEGASPFEVFLAEACETAIERDLDTYGTQRPVAICNWCTTDPLDHPNEPSPEMEDGAVVDTEHIKAKAEFAAGMFASYHVYPYYPEFLSYDIKYLEGEDPNPYLAYLKELTAYHSVPVLISEYGIPASRGIAHRNVVTGMSQGFANEEQQAKWLISMNKDIHSAGCCGGLIFTWQDEWFKRSWNTMDYEEPSRRPFWFNVQCPEECFGLLAFDPGEKDTVVTIDGDDSDWKGSKSVASNDETEIYAKSDAAYLYLLIRKDGWNIGKETINVPISVLDGYGNTHSGNLRFDTGAQYLLKLNGKDDSAITVDAAYDAFQYSYAYLHDFFEDVPGQHEKDSGNFDPVWLALNRPMHLPQTGETTEFMRVETGKLRYGNSQEDSLADFCSGEGFAEIRLPWQLIGFMDPSTKLVMGDLSSMDGSIKPAHTEGVRIGAAGEEYDGVISMDLYTWDDWEIPEYHERLKESYSILKDYFSGTN